MCFELVGSIEHRRLNCCTMISVADTCPERETEHNQSKVQLPRDVAPDHCTAEPQFGGSAAKRVNQALSFHAFHHSRSYPDNSDQSELATSRTIPPHLELATVTTSKMSFLTRAQPMLRSATITRTAPRLFSTAVIYRDNAVKDTAKSVDRKVSDTLVKGIDKGGRS